MRPTTLLKSILLALAIALAGVAVVNAADPIPAVMPTLVADKAVTGTGKRSDPFEFTAETKCILRLMGTASDVRWTMDDAPPDIEVLGNALVFSLASPGEYVVFGSWSDGAVVAWLRIKGPNGPPTPEDDITRRVKAALAGQPADAIKFKAACDALAASLDAGEIKTLGQMEDALASGLKAVGWVPGKYPDLSRLSGELFGSGVNDGPIDAATKSRFVASLKTISVACGGVK